MFFNKNTSLQEINTWLEKQLTAVYNASKTGIDIEVKPHHITRTNEQNRFLMAILVALVRFYDETGFMPSGLKPWEMRTTILKEYYKDRFGVANTHKLDTVQFSFFIDRIQQSLVEESGGEWEILTTDSAYLKALIRESGL